MRNGQTINNPDEGRCLCQIEITPENWKQKIMIFVYEDSITAAENYLKQIHILGTIHDSRYCNGKFMSLDEQTFKWDSLIGAWIDVTWLDNPSGSKKQS